MAPVQDLPIDSLVRYYLQGWYTGHVAEVSAKTVTIRPIGPKPTIRKRLVVVCWDDIEIIKQNA